MPIKGTDVVKRLPEAGKKNCKECGFSPFLESNDDILDVYSGGEPRRVVALALEPGTEHLFAPTPLVRFYEGSSPKSQSNP